VVCGAALLTEAACSRGGNETPKPQAYLRIDMPEPAYTLCDTAVLPFTFERSNLSQLEWKKVTPREKWFTLVYPKYKGYVFLTYKAIKGEKDLREQIDTSYHIIESHFSFSSGVDENRFVDRPHRLSGTTYHLKGQNVASTYQFWVTDSVSHFLRGALYIDCTPNNDSLAPVLDYLQADIDHLIESVRWR
jgi:gliding motility-associated lipoprotein GldD